MASLIGNDTPYPPALDAEASEALTTALRDWALTHGLVIRAPVSQGALADESALYVPHTLFPSPFPRRLFDEARGIMVAFNELYVRVADDTGFIEEITAELAGVDDFVEGLWKVYKEVQAETNGIPTQPLSLGVFRSDYLLHVPTPTTPPSLRQVELNTISASFGGLSSRVADAHIFARKAGLYPESEVLVEANMPENPSARGIARGIACAHEAYCAAAGVKGTDAIVLFIVQPGERNAFDQRWIEYYLLEAHAVRSVRATMFDIDTDATVDPVTKKLHYKNHPPVSVAYYRSGYTPTDYPPNDPAPWRARKIVELSDAVKCPTLATQFAGAKKVQQVLVDQSVLARYTSSPETATALRATFAEILPLDKDSPGGVRARELIRAAPQKYVLKPQREGGGNNVYKDKIPGFLESLPDESYWKGYILMELIEPPADVTNSIMRAGDVKSGPVVSELGIFGCVLWDSSTHEVKENFEAGWLLRTKFAESEEGGVAAGFGSIDSVLLV
ncbi:glutathione synthase [Limtongia smithiae]|uniref:glutathione synthase n=1 Tax=Limtongia smithiae TaxID=1125753 RepID=UPI0034CE7776